MIQPGSKSLRKIAVVGRGTAGALAAASVTCLHPDSDHELHHIYDSRIPAIGVGEGSWPSLVQQLQQLTGLPTRYRPTAPEGYPQVRRCIRRMGACATRTSLTTSCPKKASYAYHLSADLLADLLRESTHARPH